MFPLANLRPLIAVAMATALVAVGGISEAVLAQGLQWQRGGAGSSSDNAMSRQAGAVSRSTLQDAQLRRAQEASVHQQVAYQEPADSQPVSRAKRPTPRKMVTQAAVVNTTVDSTNHQATQPVQQASGNSEMSFASDVQQAVVQSDQATTADVEQTQYACGVGSCSCGFCVDGPGCAVPEPGCCVAEPGCGCGPEVCGPAGCGDCVCGDVGCSGSCVGAAPCGCGAIGCYGSCADRGAIPIVIYLPPIKELVLFAGVQGFKSPLDYSPTTRDGGNFGFHQGINLGGRMSWLPWPGLGFQVGYQSTQNQLSGDVGSGSAKSHSQNFLTAGLFKRRPVGMQYGIVYDLLQDERQASTNFSQVRGLFSFTNPYGSELGFEFAQGTSEQAIGGITYQPADQYKLFWRHHGPSGGEFRGYVGGSGDNHAIVGADLSAPLNHRWSIQSGFTYFIPNDNGTIVGTKASEEAWQLGVNLVWHFGARGQEWFRSPWRPMFNVANNGSLVIDDID